MATERSSRLATPEAPRHLDLGRLTRDRSVSVLVTCGSGGVGKTTTAAALALYAAENGRKVAVMTVDPARRLAQSLGIAALDNEPRRVELAQGGNPETGELWAMMLDTRRTFDEMISGHATRERAEAILNNPFYRTISSSFSGTQEYMAMEKLSQLAARGEFDLIVVDTPPSRSALDFLDAPQRLGAFLDGRMIRLLGSPGRGMMKIVGAGLTLFTRAVTSVIGGQMLTDAGNFVQLFESMFGGFRERAQATYDLLRSSSTAFVVVAAPEPDALREASYFTDRLRAERMPLTGLVINRTHPPTAELGLARANAAAEHLADTADHALALTALELHADLLTARAQERRMSARFVRSHPDVPVVEVPALAADVHDLAALRAIGVALTEAGGRLAR